MGADRCGSGLHGAQRCHAFVGCEPPQHPADEDGTNGVKRQRAPQLRHELHVIFHVNSDQEIQRWRRTVGRVDAQVQRTKFTALVFPTLNLGNPMLWCWRI